MGRMGQMIIDALRQRDYPTVNDVMVITSFTIVVVNLMVDITYGIIDPKVKYAEPWQTRGIAGADAPTQANSLRSSPRSSSGCDRASARHLVLLLTGIFTDYLAPFGMNETAMQYRMPCPTSTTCSAPTSWAAT